MTFGIQAKAALKNGELDAEQLRELLLMIAQYSGYPRAASMLAPLETAIAEVEKDKSATASSDG
jgi:alkylhydroperoxidase/carboxymuconolactone decarboxylase family protein YurZ